jgi:hypothetical protein
LLVYADRPSAEGYVLTYKNAAALLCIFTISLFVAAPAHSQSDVRFSGLNLNVARAGFRTSLIREIKVTDPVADPPAGFKLVHYPAPLGSFPAYLTEPPNSAVRHPAIIWLIGGFDNSIGETSWAPAPAEDDQSARAFAAAGVVTMYPSLRGGNNNPGYIEDGYGEVDDVSAAAKFLAQQPDVDPKRIYLGGHSTGGTLAMLLAETTSRFRAIFAFGPVCQMKQYGQQLLNFDINDNRETDLRSPLLYLDAITSPTFVFEGMVSPSNIKQLQAYCTENANHLIHFYQLPDYDHLSDLSAITPIIAAQIVADRGLQPKFSFLHDGEMIEPAAPLLQYP